MTALLLLLATSGVIHVKIDGGADKLLVFHAGKRVAEVAVDSDGDIQMVTLRDLPYAAVDLVALSATGRSEVVRRVRPVIRKDGDSLPDAWLHVKRCHRLTVRAEAGSVVHVGGATFPADEPVPLLPGLHRIVVDHPEFVSSAARLVRVGADRELKLVLHRGLVVAGTVVGPDGKPVSGARIDIFTDGFPTGRASDTDRNGAFHCSGFRGDVVSLRASSTGRATRLMRVDFEPGSTRARVVIPLAAGASVTLPVAGMGDTQVQATLLPRWVEETLEQPRLRMNDRPQRVSSRGTGRRGVVTFSGLTPGRSYRITVEARGRLPATTDRFVAGEVERLPRLELRPAAALRGTLWKSLPKPGLLVVARGAFGDRACRTAGDGSFAFESLPPGKLLVLVRDLDERGTTFELGEAEDKTVELALEAPAQDRSLSGTVVDADREPLAGIRVTASGQSVLTDKEGAFTIHGVAVGRKSFAVRLEPTPASRAFLEDPHLPRIERKVRVGITMRAQLQRAGVLDLKWPKARLARATLFLAGTAGIEQRRRIPHGARSMRIEEVPVGSYLVEIGAPGFVGTGGVAARATPKGEPSVIDVMRGRSVSGRVVLRRSLPVPDRAPRIIDEPLRRGRVTLIDTRGQYALASVVVAEDGTFLIEGLPAVPLLLCAAAPGYPTIWRRVDVTREDIEDLTLPMHRARDGKVRVIGSRGKFVTGTRVSVRNEFGVDMRDLVARARFLGVVADEEDFGDVARSFAITVAPGGIFTHGFMAPGNYEFVATAPGYKPGKGKVRVRLPWTLAHIGEAVPVSPEDIVAIIRLSPVPVDREEEKSGGD